MKILTLTNEQVLELADMRASVDELRSAFALLAKGAVESPVRTRFRISDVRNILLMPSLVRDKVNMASLKIVTVYPDLGPDVPSTRAVVLLTDAVDGSVKCIMGGTALTAVRTGAVSGLSCRYLARKDSRSLAMIGAGGQGFFQISGVSSQLGIQRVSVFDVDPGRRKKLAERCKNELHIESVACESVGDATAGADVIVTATTSKTPVLDANQVGPGTHVVAIGAYTPESRELGSALVSKASLFVDSVEAAMEEAGDLLIPISEGAISKEGVKGDLAGLVTGKVGGRANDSEVTIFKAVGLAFEDNAVGSMVHRLALGAGVGKWVEL
ncbi:MAG: ornithine cyclodeaminase family protein [Thaumarchaeota archaeon]|nr:ornithine cyclodeaminase family protein [Nitrososphaerota archaeon]